jgi:hypothetical protein
MLKSDWAIPRSQYVTGEKSSALVEGAFGFSWIDLGYALGRIN